MSWFNFHFSDFAFSFLSMLFEGVPFLLLGALVAGVVDVFIPARWITGLLPKNPTGAVFFSGLLGGIFPMCECGSVIVIRRFLAKGLPPACAVAYMLGAPIVSPLVALSTYAAFQGQSPWMMTSFRLLLGYTLAVGAGLAVQRMRLENVLQPFVLRSLTGLRREAAPPAEGAVPALGGGASARTSRTDRRGGLKIAVPLPASDPDDGTAPEGAAAIVLPEEDFKAKLYRLARSATSDFLDVAFFFVIGAAITAVFNTAVRQEVILPLATNHFLSSVAMMALSAVLALCSTTDAFIAATFVAFPFTAKLAFLVFGPLVDVKLFFLYGMTFRRRFIILLAIGLFAATLIICTRLAVLNL